MFKSNGRGCENFMGAAHIKYFKFVYFYHKKNDYKIKLYSNRGGKNLLNRKKESLDSSILIRKNPT